MKKVFTPQGHESTPRIGEMVPLVLTSFVRAKFNRLLLILILLPLAGYGQNCQLVVGEITGPSNACAHIGSVGQVATYSVETTDASAFDWTIPTQANLLSGQGTNTIALKYKTGFAAGVISVTISSACGSDTITRSLNINTALPTTPGGIAGPAVLCDLINSPVTYTVDPVVDGVQYRWTLPTNATFISGQGTNTIKVNFSSRFRTGALKVRAVSGCGASGFFTYALTAKGPAQPGPIAGRTNGICVPANVVEYNIDPVPFAVSYTWTTSVEGAEIANDGTKATITFPPFGSGIVRVAAAGTCGLSSVRLLNVTSKGLAPELINGPDSACQGTVQTFRVNPVAGATSYDWSVPDGSVINTGAGTPSITVEIGSQGGPVTVRASNGCDPGTAVGRAFKVQQCEVEVPVCKIDVYPIPTSGVLHIRFETSGKGTYKIEVKHASMACGRLFSSSGCYQPGENKYCIDLSALPDGYYIIYVTTNEFTHQERIEIRH